MRNVIALIALTMSFSVMAAPKVKYGLCQNAVDQLFTVDNLSEAQLNNGSILSEDKSFPAIQNGQTPLFKLNEKGELDEEESKVMKSKFDESTGQYLFRLKNEIVEAHKKKHVAQYEKMVSEGKIEKEDIPPFDVHLKEYIVKKDDNGRIFSIEEKGNPYCDSCSRKIEMAYSKKRCVPKNIVETKVGNEQIVANIVACKNLDALKKDLFKRMKKVNKCLDVMNEHYREANEMAKVVLGNLDNEALGRDTYEQSEFYKNLEKVRDQALELKESDSALGDRMTKQTDFDTLYHGILKTCGSYFGKDTVSAKKVFSDKDGSYQIKRDKTGVKIDNPLEELRRVNPK